MMEYERITKNKGVGRFVKSDCITCRNHKDDKTGCDFCGGSEICDKWCCGVLYNRLAELEDKIEQGKLKEEKNCKNISEMHPVDGFTCSECGISLEDYCEKEVDEESGDITYREYMLRYCPNCGAKVVY